MSLEKSIQKLTEVIQAQTPPAPGTGPAFDSSRAKIPCKGDPKKGSPGYCNCYKINNQQYEGPCYYKSINNKCYVLTYHTGPGIPDRGERILAVNEECPIGIPGVA